jgi:PTH1 family peptidyl-tRNA hydrolase
MKLIVGLGNPGDKYTATRHNAGFWLIERLAAQSGTVLRKDGKFQALVGRHEASGAWLMLPQTYMNTSGRAVQMMASFFKIPPADVLIVHDELDLPPGTVRLKQGGGVAGHNGLKDISARLGSHDYWRLRLGIGRPPDRGATIDYVLHKPAQDERTAIDEAIARSLEVLPLVLAGDTQGAMLKLHTQEPEQKAEQPPKSDRAAKPERPEQPETLEKPVKPGKARAAETTHVAETVEKPGVVAAGPVEQQAAPVRTPVQRASSIERFGDAAEAARVRQAEKVEKTEKTGTIEETGKTDESGKAPKKGGLNSLLKKFLPGTGPDRKK